MDRALPQVWDLEAAGDRHFSPYAERHDSPFTSRHVSPYADTEAQADDGEPFQEKMTRLVARLREQQAEAAKLDAAIAANLKELGYGR